MFGRFKLQKNNKYKNKTITPTFVKRNIEVEKIALEFEKELYLNHNFIGEVLLIIKQC